MPKLHVKSVVNEFMGANNGLVLEAGARGLDSS